MPFFVRRATLADAEQMVDCQRTSITGLLGSDYGPTTISEWARTIEASSFIARMSDDKSVTFVAIEHETKRVIGIGRLELSTGGAGCYVRPGCQRQGVAASLIRTAFTEAKAMCLRTGTINSTLGAVPFYRRMGYTEQEQTFHRVWSGTSIPVVRMTIKYGSA